MANYKKGKITFFPRGIRQWNRLFVSIFSIIILCVYYFITINTETFMELIAIIGLYISFSEGLLTNVDERVNNSGVNNKKRRRR